MSFFEEEEEEEEEERNELLRLSLELSETSSDDDSDHEEQHVFTDGQHSEHLDFKDDKPEEDNDNRDSSALLLVKLLAIMLLTWQALFNISDNAITALLLCLRQLMAHWKYSQC